MGQVSRRATPFGRKHVFDDEVWDVQENARTKQQRTRTES